MRVDDAIHGISTLIQVQTASGTSQGTGFFYQQLAPKDPSKEGQWRAIEDAWLITNRHVLLPQPATGSLLPTSLTFHLRKVVNGSVVWEPITLDQDALLARVKLHANPDVDVCAIRVLDLLTEKLKSGEQYLPWYGVSNENLAGQNKINPHVASDAVVVGYPRGTNKEVSFLHGHPPILHHVSRNKIGKVGDFAIGHSEPRSRQHDSDCLISDGHAKANFMSAFDHPYRRIPP